jgi:hypothetical protein
LVHGLPPFVRLLSIDWVISFMNDIKIAIELLSKHNYRSTSNVVGEYVEKLVAAAINGEQASHCQKGFDIFSQSLGRVEVKSRNFHAKSQRCTLPTKKLDALDSFILVVMRDGEIEKALLFPKQTLLSMKPESGNVYVDKRHHAMAKDITLMFSNQPLDGNV